MVGSFNGRMLARLASHEGSSPSPTTKIYALVRKAEKRTASKAVDCLSVRV